MVEIVTVRLTNLTLRASLRTAKSLGSDGMLAVSLVVCVLPRAWQRDVRVFVPTVLPPTECFDQYTCVLKVLSNLGRERTVQGRKRLEMKQS